MVALWRRKVSEAADTDPQKVVACHGNYVVS